MELKCPVIYKNGTKIGYGGNQDWYEEEWWRRAGCGSVTGANIAAYYTLHCDTCENLWTNPSYTPEHGDYLELMRTMYGYMTPGFMGYPLVGRFSKDFTRFAKERGVTVKAHQLFLPKKKEECLAFIKEGLDTDNPVALLILRHPAKRLREDNWHWVTVMGYDDETHSLIWSNCGVREEINWDMLFDEDVRFYIGMVRFEQK